MVVTGSNWVRRKWLALAQIAFMAWVMGKLVHVFLRETWRGFVTAAGQIWRGGA